MFHPATYHFHSFFIEQSSLRFQMAESFLSQAQNTECQVSGRVKWVSLPAQGVGGGGEGGSFPLPSLPPPPPTKKGSKVRTQRAHEGHNMHRHIGEGGGESGVKTGPVSSRQSCASKILGPPSTESQRLNCPLEAEELGLLVGMLLLLLVVVTIVVGVVVVAVGSRVGGQHHARPVAAGHRVVGVLLMLVIVVHRFRHVASLKSTNVSIFHIFSQNFNPFLSNVFILHISPKNLTLFFISLQNLNFCINNCIPWRIHICNFPHFFTEFTLFIKCFHSLHFSHNFRIVFSNLYVSSLKSKLITQFCYTMIKYHYMNNNNEYYYYAKFYARNRLTMW